MAGDQIRTYNPRWPRRLSLAQELEQNGQRRGPLLNLDGRPDDDDGSLVEVERAPGQEDGKPLGPDFYHEVRYEELVSEPAKACRLCAFLGLPTMMPCYDSTRDGRRRTPTSTQRRLGGPSPLG